MDEASKIYSSAVPPGFRPAHSGAVRRSKRRNGAHRPALLQGSGQPLGSELQPAPARKPSQPVKPLSLLRCARLLSPSLRLEYSGRGHQITMNHLTTFRAGLQAAQADFGEYPLFSCVLLGDFFAGRGLPAAAGPFRHHPRATQVIWPSSKISAYQRRKTNFAKVANLCPAGKVGSLPIRGTLPRWQTINIK